MGPRCARPATRKSAHGMDSSPNAMRANTSKALTASSFPGLRRTYDRRGEAQAGAAGERQGEVTKLPAEVYVTWCPLANDDPYLKAERKAADCIEDDGPTVIGIYELVRTVTMEKVVKVTNHVAGGRGKA